MHLQVLCDPLNFPSRHFLCGFKTFDHRLTYLTCHAFLPFDSNNINHREREMNQSINEWTNERRDPAASCYRWSVWSSSRHQGQITPCFGGICRIYLKLLKEDQEITTCGHVLDLETRRGSWTLIPRILLPGCWDECDLRIQNRDRCPIDLRNQPAVSANCVCGAAGNNSRFVPGQAPSIPHGFV